MDEMFCMIRARDDYRRLGSNTESDDRNFFGFVDTSMQPPASFRPPYDPVSAPSKSSDRPLQEYHFNAKLRRNFLSQRQMHSNGFPSPDQLFCYQGGLPGWYELPGWAEAGLRVDVMECCHGGHKLAEKDDRFRHSFSC